MKKRRVKEHNIIYYYNYQVKQDTFWLKSVHQRWPVVTSCSLAMEQKFCSRNVLFTRDQNESIHRDTRMKSEERGFEAV